MVMDRSDPPAFADTAPAADDRVRPARQHLQAADAPETDDDGFRERRRRRGPASKRSQRLDEES